LLQAGLRHVTEAVADLQPAVGLVVDLVVGVVLRLTIGPQPQRQVGLQGLVVGRLEPGLRLLHDGSVSLARTGQAGVLRDLVVETIHLVAPQGIGRHAGTGDGGREIGQPRQHAAIVEVGDQRRRQLIAGTRRRRAAAMQLGEGILEQVGKGGIAMAATGGGIELLQVTGDGTLALLRCQRGSRWWHRRRPSWCRRHWWQ
jgi:hypothetical protein